MADTVREIERKYEADGGADGAGQLARVLPDLTGVDRIASVAERGAVTLDATYYDTADRRLARDGITLRRRTGGDDAGWHLKLPVAAHVRDEIRAPLSGTVPRALRGLLRSRTRDAELVPLVRIGTRREVRQLLAADGTVLAEIAADRVRAERPAGPGRAAEWAEIEVELTPGGDGALLDAVETRLLGAGLRPATTASKAARALRETAPEGERTAVPKGGRRAVPEGGQKAAAFRGGAGEPVGAGPEEAVPPTAVQVVHRYLARQVRALVELDPAVRRDLPDSVHQMRVATRRLRSALRSYATVLDRSATDPVGQELKWLAAELGVGRDAEVLAARLQEGLAALPKELRPGPVRSRLRTWTRARRKGSRKQLLAVLDGPRYLALLESLDALLADPPLAPAAGRPAARVLPKAVERDFRRLAGHVEAALAAPPGPARDLAMHEARKAAKRTRYAAEAARPELGRPAKELATRMTELQELLGGHQDGVAARAALRELAAQAHAAGENAFAYGVLYAREESRAAALESALPTLWSTIPTPHLRPGPTVTAPPTGR
ncbi:metal-binding protein [Streptomyces sp. Ru73]|uniref:CYTH and CHAD domain-containing protein n=1 Tax=Streptomyces sp. Ru73 TaxID=2080748 RepID=UPI000CDE3E5A|nr:CYTH and CHAD domain-containing protein [Streptomyces sp. Ru73]POX38121.1 metal-binding protein [Streptomyces sp. Ru73]